MRTKQVIVIRKDLKMRRGKEIAQGSHASMAFLTRRIEYKRTFLDRVKRFFFKDIKPVEALWMANSFAKVTLQISGEKELLDIYDAASRAGLETHLITDSGKTEFHGRPTHTCLAIGPDDADRIDEITSELALY